MIVFLPLSNWRWPTSFGWPWRFIDEISRPALSIKERKAEKDKVSSAVETDVSGQCTLRSSKFYFSLSLANSLEWELAERKSESIAKALPRVSQQLRPQPAQKGAEPKTHCSNSFLLPLFLLRRPITDEQKERQSISSHGANDALYLHLFDPSSTSK